MGNEVARAAVNAPAMKRSNEHDNSDGEVLMQFRKKSKKCSGNI